MIKRLPRKLKKNKYGTRGNRKHLALALMDKPDVIKSIVDIFNNHQQYDFLKFLI